MASSRNVIRIVLSLVVFVTFLANFIFILQTSRQMNEFHSNIHPKQDTVQVEPPQKLQEEPEDSSKADAVLSSEYLDIQVFSSKENVSVIVNGKAVVELTKDLHRGLSVTVLNQATGTVMAARTFDTYASKEESKALVDFVNSLAENRILCFAVKDEAAFALQKVARVFMKSYGSAFFGMMSYRSMWAMVVQRSNHANLVHAEGFQGDPDPGKWAKPVLIHTSVQVSPLSKSACEWVDSEETQRRRKFCDIYEGYGAACKCSDPDDISFKPPPLPDGTRLNLPIAVMASNRPQYLYRMLKSLRRAQGVRPELVNVFIDGFAQEPAAVVKLLGLRAIPHKPVSERNAKITQHYKRTLTESFDRYPDANYLVILEEDLDVSVDILSYFHQLLPVLENDPSVYCISAWNDQGYKHSANDPNMLYRIETMPGLGWVLSRKLYKDELEPKWPGPSMFVDWDMWMRGPEQRKGREAIIPDISRTYHFGGKGLNVNLAFQESYFGSHAFNSRSDVKFDVDMMYKDNYEKELHRLLGEAQILDHSKTPCTHKEDFIPNTRNKTYLFFFKLNYHGDWETWTNIARCFLLWDLDVRGFHKDLWRMWIRGNHVIYVGCPISEYCSYKPADLSPIDMPDTHTRPPQNTYLITAE